MELLFVLGCTTLSVNSADPDVLSWRKLRVFKPVSFTYLNNDTAVEYTMWRFRCSLRRSVVDHMKNSWAPLYKQRTALLFIWNTPRFWIWRAPSEQQTLVSKPRKRSLHHDLTK